MKSNSYFHRTSAFGIRRARPVEESAAVDVRARPVEPPASTSVGRIVLGRYRIRSLLGRGGMGRVWLADDELLARSVALKQYVPRDSRPEASERSARARVLNEARAAARVDHPGVVRIHDVIRDEEQLWIVMEPLTGRTLADVIKSDGPLPAESVASIAMLLLDALRAVHAAGVLHCDLKPGNVQLCEGGRVVLTDFGIARRAGSTLHPSPSEFTGSPAYVSPERVRGGELRPASDMFSLGATLFAAAEGRSPFEGRDVIGTLMSVVEDPAVPSERAGVLRPVIEGLLAKEPEHRLTADEAFSALQAARRMLRSA
jgi:serine/threonine protein kinase